MFDFLRKKKNLPFLIGGFLIVLGILARFLPHSANFSPIGALALFAGFYLPKKWALIIPVLAMLVSDFFLGFYEPVVMVSVYFSFILTAFLASYLPKKQSWGKIAGLSVVSAILFFVLTNFAVWAFTPWYAKNLSGFNQCFLLALPFFKNTLLGNLFYTAGFFGLYEILQITPRIKAYLLVKK